MPRQDRLHWQTLPGRRLIAVLADGAGSAALAEVGAESAVRLAGETLAARVPTFTAKTPDDEWKGVLRSALQAARDAVLAEATQRKVPPRDLATTLLLLVATPELVAAAQIGDGASVVSDGHDVLSAPTRPQLSEYINETTFLTAEDALEKAQFAVCRGRFPRVALFSDGLEMLALKLPEATPHGPFFAPLFRFAESAPDLKAAPAQLEAFLESPRITNRTDDDLSLLVATLPAD